MSKRKLPFEVRKVRRPQHTILISIPKRFSDWLKVGDGSLVKIEMDRDDEHSVAPGRRLIITKVSIPGIDDDDNGNVSSVQ